jgi:hypothetical protein
MNDLRVPLRVVLYTDDGNWIAHCLEFDLLGDGATKPAAIETLVEAIRLQIEETVRHDNPANLFSPASGEIFELFAAGSDCAELGFGLDHLQSRSQAPVLIEGVQVREFLGVPVPLAVS